MSKKLIIDLRGALLEIERNTGEKKSVTDISKEFGITNSTFQNWDVKAPNPVKFVFEFEKKYNVKLLKEI